MNNNKWYIIMIKTPKDPCVAISDLSPLQKY